jgi:myo-inositol-1(or 4)-monophosphatase
MTQEMIETRLQVALQAARNAGAFVKAAREKGKIEVREKRTNDFVTDIDRQSERLIISCIKENFPDDAVFGEESGKSGDGSKGRWIIDPIDGTTDFFRGIPDYTISIAWELEPFDPLVGVVFNPEQDELFWGSRDGGAYLNGKPISVSSIADPGKALLVCVPPHRHHGDAQAYFDREQALFLQSSDIRSFGSCALELAYIGAGRLDGYYERFLGYYDLAAGMAIVKEAGGTVGSADPSIPFSDTVCDLVASNGLIHQWILHMVHP